MKTVLFALQLILTMALLPVCAVLDLNHATRPALTPAAQVSSRQQEAAAVATNDLVMPFPCTTLLPAGKKIKAKKKSSGLYCTCRNCACGADCKCADL